ncbi:hypothetical protein [Candidatus Enterovibrio escicola]|uniref:hypothetical protein n=2 Tax=Candidatus Enterovibrio escicola TaxID=1927127 RepID=UPI001680E4BD|nr:hypothetical protein [Candidatus Enterovibrio escacola]
MVDYIIKVSPVMLRFIYCTFFLLLSSYSQAMGEDGTIQDKSDRSFDEMNVTITSVKATDQNKCLVGYKWAHTTVPVCGIWLCNDYKGQNIFSVAKLAYLSNTNVKLSVIAGPWPKTVVAIETWHK